MARLSIEAEEMRKQCAILPCTSNGVETLIRVCRLFSHDLAVGHPVICIVLQYGHLVGPLCGCHSSGHHVDDPTPEHANGYTRHDYRQVRARRYVSRYVCSLVRT
jgi:hypothetical protein